MAVLTDDDNPGTLADHGIDDIVVITCGGGIDELPSQVLTGGGGV